MSATQDLPLRDAQGQSSIGSSLGIPRPSARSLWLLLSIALTALCWMALWNIRSYWNPIFFFGLWTGATMFTRGVLGKPCLPLRRQLGLMATSVPLWWWFELVNERVQNWDYHGAGLYGPVAYAVLATLAFSTVVPAIDVASDVTLRRARSTRQPREVLGRNWGMREIAAGLAAQVLVFALPRFFYPLVWIAPFLVIDGVVGLAGRRNLAWELVKGDRRIPLLVGLAGITCGFFWEFWNFWAMPKWSYSIPFLGFFHVFEMPILGYLGYVPFAWSVFQMVELVEWLWGRGFLQPVRRREGGQTRSELAE